MSVKDYSRNLFTRTHLPPAYAQGARAGIIWIVLFLIGLWADQIALGFQAGFVGWVGVMFTDDSVGIGRRLGGALFMSFAIAVTAFIAVLAGNTLVWAVIGATGLAFVISLLGIRGPSGVKKALVINFLTMFTIGFPGDLTTAASMAAVSIAGGLAAMLLIIVWLPFDKSRDPYSVRAREYFAATELARLYAEQADAETISATRTRITNTTVDVYSDARLDRRSSATRRTPSVEQASTILRSCYVFADVRELSGGPPTPEILEMYRAVSIFCLEAAQNISEHLDIAPDQLPAVRAIDVVLDQISVPSQQTSSGSGALRDLRSVLNEIAGDDEQVAYANSVELTPDKARFGANSLARLRAALTTDTVLRRHALRYATLIAITTALYKGLDIPDGYFIPIGVTIMLQADLGAGFTRLQIFSLGTILGSVIGGILGVTLDSYPVVLTVVAGVVIFFMLSYFNITYWAWAIGVSVIIVSTLGLLVPGGWDLAFWRVADTLIAAVFVALGLLFLWPTRGREAVRLVFSRTLNSCANYLRQAAASAPAADLESTRRDIIVEELSLAMHIEAYEREPGHDRTILAELKRGLIEVRLITGSITDLTLNAADLTPDDDRNTRSVTHSVTASLDEVSQAFADNEAPERLPRLVAPDIPRPLTTEQAEMRDIGVCAQALVGMVPIQSHSGK